MPGFVKNLTFSQALHLAGLGIVTALTWTHIISVVEGMPMIAALIGLGINTNSGGQ